MAETGGLVVIDLEENDLAEFTDTTAEAGNTIAASTDYILHGSYSLKITFGGSNNGAWGYYTFGAGQTTVYCRIYFHIDTLSMAENDYIDLFSLKDGADSGSLIMGVRIYDKGVPGEYGLYVEARENGGGQIRVNKTNDSIFLDDTDYYIEVYWKAGAGDGEDGFWINGVEEYTASGKTNDNFNIDTIVVGDREGSVPTGGTIYIDDIKADTSPVGAYPVAGGIVVLRRRRM